MSDLFFKTREETQAWLDEMVVADYMIHDNLTVDVDGDVNISNKNLKCISVRFGIVNGGFYCNLNQLTSLAGSPVKCDEFWCNENQLTSLIGSPHECRIFRCSGNKLTSLAGAPVKVDHFSCRDNQLTDLIGGPERVDTFTCCENHLTSLTGSPQECRIFRCTGNSDLYDISAAPDGCKLFYDQDVVAKNQAANQLTMFDISTSDKPDVLPRSPGRAL